MKFRDLILRNRSTRRFIEDIPINIETLQQLIDLARLSPSSANHQPLKYHISNDPKTNSMIFSHLVWAGYLKDWLGPPQGERPSAYIIILCDTSITKSVDCDHGIAAQSILLGATEMGYGGCIIGGINRAKIRESLNISQQYKIKLVIALGKPKEDVVLESIGADGDIKYWRDEDKTHHVPKRSLDEIILNQKISSRMVMKASVELQVRDILP